MIFESPDNRYPSVEELVLCDLFRNIDLREMRGPSISVSSKQFVLHRLENAFSRAHVHACVCWYLFCTQIDEIINNFSLWLCSHSSMVWVYRRWICWMRFDEDRALHWMARTAKVVHHAHHPQHHGVSGKLFRMFTWLVCVITPNKKREMNKNNYSLLNYHDFLRNVFRYQVLFH